MRASGLTPTGHHNPEAAELPAGESAEAAPAPQGPAVTAEERAETMYQEAVKLPDSASSKNQQISENNQ